MKSFCDIFSLKCKNSVAEMNDEKAHKFVRFRRLFLVTMQYFQGQNATDFARFAGNAVAKRKPPTAVDGCILSLRAMQKTGVTVPGVPRRGRSHRGADPGEREQEDDGGNGKCREEFFLDPFQHGGPPPVLHCTSAAPSARQPASASSSGASWAMTLSAANTAPAATHSASQLRIHSPSPQP